jgi:exonuclease V gamma subunit
MKLKFFIKKPLTYLYQLIHLHREGEQTYMAQPIPGSWRKTVVCILQTEDDHQIEWTMPALQRWKTDTFGAWKNDAYIAMIAALSMEGIEGNETTSMGDQIATYEFLFHFKNKRMYGKIALRKNRLQILILSAHNAQRPTLS